MIFISKPDYHHLNELVILSFVLHTLIIIDFSRTVINSWRILTVFLKYLKKGCKGGVGGGGEIVTRINSHPSMSTALSPGHKATNQIEKYEWFGCFGS